MAPATKGHSKCVPACPDQNGRNGDSSTSSLEIPKIRIRKMSKVLQQAKASKENLLMDALNENTTVASEVKRFGRPREKDEPGIPR